MSGVCLNTGTLVGIDSETHGRRARNHSRNHRLRETGQSADDAGSNTACRAHARTAADLIADADDIANDDIHEARGLHDADEKQNARHVGNYGI